MTLALLLLAAAPTMLFDRVLSLRPAEIKALHFSVKNRPATLDVEFRASRPDSTVRLLVIPQPDLPRLEAGRDAKQIATSEFATQGRLKTYIATPGEYLVVVDNRHQGQTALRVQVKGSVTSDTAAKEAHYLSFARQVTVITSSLALFLGIAVVAGRRLWAATVGQQQKQEGYGPRQ